VVSAAVCVFGNASTEFTEGHHEDAIKNPFSFQVVTKRGKSGTKVIQQTLVCIGLAGVCVVASLACLIDTSGQAAGNQAGNEAE
jgi:hypothetical protein